MEVKEIKILFYLLFFVTPFVDSVTGYFINMGFMAEGALFSPAQIYKIFLFSLFFKYCFPYIKKDLGYMLILSILLLLLYESIISMIFFLEIKYMLFGYVNIFKVFYLILLYYLFKTSLDRGKIEVNDLINYVMISGIICVVLVLVTKLLHIDMSTYSQGTFGSKGLFPSGNAIGLYIGGISFISLIMLKEQISIKNTFISTILVTGNLLIGTKASILFFLLMCSL